jgi:nucleotide-binding universal stress UspA family protein
MIKRIAIPLDGSPAAEGALSCAVAVARRSGAALDLVDVQPRRRARGVSERGGVPDAAMAPADPHWLEKLADRIRAESGVHARAHRLAGRAAEALPRFVAANSIDLVLMATPAEGTGAPWSEHLHDAMVRRAGTPILLVPAGVCAAGEGEWPPFRRFLVALDGSAAAEEMLHALVPLALALDAEITLIQIVTPGETGGTFYAPNRMEIDRAIREADAYLHVAAARLPASLRWPRIRVAAQPNAAIGIIEEAGAGGFDLVALASHGKSGTQQLLVGSTADRVLRGLAAPTLLCPVGHAAGQSLSPASGLEESIAAV